MMQTDTGRTPVPSRKPSRLSRLGTRRLARAHLTLAQRPRVAQLARQALSDICGQLGRDLGCALTAEARLLESVIRPLTGLGHSPAFALFELSGRGGMAVLEVDTPVLFAALDRLSGAGQKLGLVTRLTRLEEAAFAYLLLSALSAFRAHDELHRRFAPRLTSMTMNRAEAVACLDDRQPHVGVELALTVAQLQGSARLVLPAVVLEAGVRDVPAERARDIAPEVLAAALWARCFIGSTPLPHDAFEVIAVGDVIIFEDVRREAGSLRGPGRLVARGFELAGDFSVEGFSLTRASTRGIPKELSMVAVTERIEGMPPLPVDVEIELTRLMVPLSELAALKPGGVLPLHINASEPVLLRVGDRAVARAELVEIEGEVGARILALLP
ncbi:type III secretion system cytoplasmic ring protein SctQ [Myxococcaceae bacterium GXIMD 01537]